MGNLRTQRDSVDEISNMGFVLNVVTYNVIMNALCKHKMLSEARALFFVLEPKGCSPGYGFLQVNKVKVGVPLHSPKTTEFLLVLMVINPSGHF